MSAVLVVVAHPDDEVLGCGGVIARHVAKGDDVQVIVLAEGVTSRDRERNRSDREKEISSLRQQAEQAHAILGTGRIKFYDFPDNRLDSVALLDIVKVIERHIEEIRPHTVYTHWQGDLNIDHQITCRAVVTATRPQPQQCVARVLAFETLSASEWNFSHSPFPANYFQDISEFLDRKLRALAAYSGELRAWPHPRSLQALETQARMHGAMVGRQAVERFVLLRDVS